MSLFTCMSAPWVGSGLCDSLKWVYLRAVVFWETVLWILCFWTDKWLQLPTPMDTCRSSDMETPGHEWLVLGCASCLKAAKMCGIFLLPGNHQGMSQGAKGKKETIKCGGCRECGQDEPRQLSSLFVQPGCEALLECLLVWLWHAVRAQGWASSCPGSAPSPSQAQVSIHITWSGTDSCRTKGFFMSYCGAIKGIQRYTRVVFKFYVFCYF